MAEPRWLTKREQRAWRAYMAMEHHLGSRVARELQQATGLSGADYEVLVNLSEAPDERLRPMELGRATEWEKSRLSHHLTRMEERGLVKRQACPTDNRGAHIVLTAKGRKAIEAAAPQHVEHVRRLFIDALTAEQLDALADIAETIVAKLGEDPEACPPC